MSSYLEKKALLCWQEGGFSHKDRGPGQTVASFRFEDDDENEDQVQLLLIVRMLKSVTVMA